MVFDIDGSVIELERGKSILDAANILGLCSDTLSERPLAAQIGGEVFNLSYTPFRDSSIHLLRYRDEEGKRVYERTLEFIFIIAVRRLFPGARVCVRHSLGSGLYLTIDKQPALSFADAEALNYECQRIVDADVPLIRKRLDIKEALAYYEADGQADKAKLLKWRKFSYFDVYTALGYMDYFYGEMAPSTSYVSSFKVHYLGGAVALLMPSSSSPDAPLEFVPQPKLWQVFRQSDDWGRLMTCSTASELNKRVEDGSVHELIRVNEALHEKAYSNIADKIAECRAKAIMLAGPSSSGKTTSANRIATQLRVLGLDPIMLSLDNYYIDRDDIPADENGEKDLEHINTLDIARFRRDLVSLTAGEETEVPIFNFMTGRREKNGRILKLHSDQPLIIEGIHGLNPTLIDEHIRSNDIFKVYVSALTTMNLDDHNRIKTTDVRLLRRLVRDFKTRNASMEHTLSMWASVRRGEERWIFPYQENADVILNTTLHYEIAVLKKYVYPLLLDVPPESPWFCGARSIVKFLNYFLDASVEDEIPPTSVLREFIGGNTFYN